AHVGTQAFNHPARQAIDLAVAVVQAGNQERRDLDPDVGLVDEVLERLQDRREVPDRHLVVEVLREGLQVDVRRVDVAVEVAPGDGAHVAGSYGHGPQAGGAAGVGDVGRVFEED